MTEVGMARLWGLGLGLALVGASATVSAHMELVDPAPRLAARAGGTQLKSAPCGQSANGRTETVSVFEPGATITVQWTEYINHPSYYRVAFDVDGDNDFPVRSDMDSVVREADDPAGANPVGGVVLGYVFEEPDLVDYALEITLPDVECETCTLQVVQFMYDKVGNGLDDEYYYQCADIALRYPDGSAGGGSDGSAGASGAAGLVAAAGSSETGGASATGGMASDGGTQAAGGVAALGGATAAGGASEIAAGGAPTVTSGGATAAGGGWVTGNAGALGDAGASVSDGAASDWSSSGGAPAMGGSSSLGGDTFTADANPPGADQPQDGSTASGGAEALGGQAQQTSSNDCSLARPRGPTSSVSSAAGLLLLALGLGLRRRLSEGKRARD